MGCRKTISIGKRGLRGLMLWIVLTFEIKFLNNKSFKQKPRSYFHEGLKNLINCGIICFLNILEGGGCAFLISTIEWFNLKTSLETWRLDTNIPWTLICTCHCHKAFAHHSYSEGFSWYKSILRQGPLKRSKAVEQHCVRPHTLVQTQVCT